MESLSGVSYRLQWFKLDGTASEALHQIEEKGYANEYVSDKRKVYKISAVFSSENGIIEEFLVL